jgi:N-methylhydantoinase A
MGGMTSAPVRQARFRIAVDTGGTFTDLALHAEGTRPRIFKSSTTPEDPVRGILDVLEVAAAGVDLPCAELLAQTTHFIHGTTRATNAIIAGATAKTALLVTAGHPDILLWGEGGRRGTFDLSVPYPEPFVPRSLTFEVPERVDAQGAVVRELDDAALVAICDRLRADDVEAVAVCFLWSILNAENERRAGEALKRELPAVPVTLSHELTPFIREYRRASAAALDASLKPLMGRYLAGLSQRLASEGFAGRLLVMTSSGGVLDAAEVAAAPIHTLMSGPAAAPVAGRAFAARDAENATAIVTDAGGTSFDVSVIRGGAMPQTRQARVGDRHYGHMTGFPSVDVKSVGAGGGSIAAVAADGLLHVGPESAGASPGPAAYGRGGDQATVTDACVVLGYLDPDYFLGGAIGLDAIAAHRAVKRSIAQPLGLGVQEAAAAILDVAIANMVNAVDEMALAYGLDARGAVLVSGGGSGGFYAAQIARRLGIARVVVPEAAAALSAVGMLVSDLSADFAATAVTSTASFDFAAVNAALARVTERARGFLASVSAGGARPRLYYTVEARYPRQVWDLEVPVTAVPLRSQDDAAELAGAFHLRHAEQLGVADIDSPVQTTTWHARAIAELPPIDIHHVDAAERRRRATSTRSMFFSEVGGVRGGVWRLNGLAPEECVEGPGVVESETTLTVLPPGCRATRLATGSLRLDLAHGDDR